MKTPLTLSLFVLFTAAAAVLASSVGEVKSKGQLTLGTDPQYAPFESRNERGEIVGFDVDLAAAVAKKLGVKLTVQPTVLDALPTALGSRRVDLAVSGVTARADWKKQLEFSDVYFDNSQVYAVRDGNPGKFQTSSLKGRTVGVRANTTGFLAADEQLKPKGAKLKVYSNVADGLKELRGGKVDAMILDAPSLEYLQQKQPNTYQRLETTLTSEQYVVAVKRGSDLLAVVNETIRDLRSGGEYTRLLERWIVEK
jgi:ABC-type amino acid transport substrate-binding protein